MRAVENVAAGHPYLGSDLAMRVALAGTGMSRNPLADLTPRELQTLGQIEILPVD